MMGGIIGYHAMMLQLILEKEPGDASECAPEPKEKHLNPPGTDLTKRPL